MGKRHLLFLLAVSTIALSLAFLISACSKSSSSPTGPGGSGAVITVTGRVIGINNQPVASVPVLITGLPSVNTDVNGSFTIPNVTTPYSIAVVDGTNKRALVYRGLTRPDPTLFWLGTSPGTSHVASVSGTLVPWTAITPGTKTTTKIAFVSADASGSTSPNLTSGAYTVTSNWYGASTTTTGSLYALVWDYDANNLPTSFSKFGKRSNVTLLDGTTNANQNDTLGVAQTAQVSGAINVASGYTLGSRTLAVAFESKGGMSLLSESNPVPNFTYNTPNVPGATLTILAVATKPGVGTVEAFASGLAVNATNVTMNIPAAPELSLPVANATGVTTATPFSWTAFTGGIHLLQFNGPAGQPSYIVVTAAASDTIPDLSSAGLALPKSTTYSWTVSGVAPFASTDAAAGSAGMLGFVSNIFGSTGAFGNSNSRSFTTAP